MPSEPKPATPLPLLHVENNPDDCPTLVGDGRVVARVYSLHNANRIMLACNTLAELQKPCVWTWNSRWVSPSCQPGRSFGINRVPVDTKFCMLCGHPIQEVTEDE